MSYILPIDYRKLTQNERRLVRLQYIEQQGGKCHYCKGSLEFQPPEEIRMKPIDWSLFPELFLKYPVHLHHSHVTGLTIGAVHAYCNAVLWVYHDE